MRLTRPSRARLSVLAGTTAIALGVGVGIAAGAGVEPSSYSNTIESGSSVTIKKTVHTPPIPPNPDIVFLSDTTGSMEPVLENVEKNATSIMNSVNGAQPAGATAEFAAADYKDGRAESEDGGCPSDPYAFRLGQALTTNLAAVESAITAWSPASGGCDTPESQVNALYQVATDGVGFRSSSDRIVVWFGDAPGVDPDLGHTLNEAIAELVAAHIRVIAVPVKDESSEDFGGLDSTGQATKVAEATGGEVLPEATPEEVSERILEGLKNLPVTVTPSPTCDSGLSASYDAASKTVTSGEDVSFEETLSVAPSAPDGGILHCTVDFLLNGSSVSGFQQSVAVTVPLRSTDLSLEKSVSPPLVTEGHNVTYTLTATNNGSDPDNNVSASDPLPAGETFVSGEPGCTSAASVVTCEFGTIGAGTSASKSFVVVVPLGAPSSITNTATVTGERPDSNTANNSGSATLKVNHNPICTTLAASPRELWPPNHKLHLVTVGGATDPDGNLLTSVITSVTQDEPLNALGDGDTSPDAFPGPASNQASVRAERSGTGDGRVYALHVTVTDGLGGECKGVATVSVPHDQSGAPAVDSGQKYTDF
jgi:uncharacterized repeat protein (TIGR01451 family)